MSRVLMVIFAGLTSVIGLSACSPDNIEPAKVVNSTAQVNVHVLNNLIEIPDLSRFRTIRLYLPPGYENSEARYPVLYMHDGQNLFDTTTSYAGEWGVDEALNELADTMGLKLIVVGIDNGQDKRLNELSPWPNAEFGEAEGELYTRFIAKVLKPYIDSNYRTKGEREYTAIMGSSMGGLISHYAIHQYPEVFSKAGIFSPSFWFSKQVFSHTAAHPLPQDARLFYAAGAKEGASMLEGMQSMLVQVSLQGHPAQNISSKVVAGADHNEAFWRSEFSGAIQWLFN